MSQYPSPYFAPTPDPQQPNPYGDPLSPARRASVLMMVLGVLMLLYGLCNGITTLSVSMEQLEKNMQMFSHEPPPMSVETMRTMTVVFSVVVVATGIFFLVTGGFVRRGGSASVTLALIGVCVVCLALGLLTLIAALAGIVMPAMFIGACVLAIPTALFVLLLVWLIQAARGAGRAREMQSQYQAQYMQYQQMMQQYGQAGYGYMYPPPPAPPATSAPQAPPPDQSNQGPPAQ